MNLRSTMVFGSSEPSTKPLSGRVAYLTVLQAIVDSVSETVSGASDAACVTARNDQAATNMIASRYAMSSDDASASPFSKDRLKIPSMQPCPAMKPAYGDIKRRQGGDIEELDRDSAGPDGSRVGSHRTGGARAEDYPARPVTIIVPFAAGGPADITARIVADIFSRHLGQRFIVENVGGAGGTIGTLRAARAAPDGYTVLSGHMGTNALAAAFYPDLGYDPQKDFEPIGLTAEYPELLVVRKDFPARDLHEFVAYAKANAAKLNVGHAGVGSVSYIGCLLLDARHGHQADHWCRSPAPRRSECDARGEIDYECDPVLGSHGQVRAGDVKALAIAAKYTQPDVAGRADVLRTRFSGIRFRAVLRGVRAEGHAAAGLDKLADALNEGLGEEEVQKRLPTRRRYHRARPPRPQAAGRTGAKRSRAADADHQSRGGQIEGRCSAAALSSPNREKRRPAGRALPRGSGAGWQN